MGSCTKNQQKFIAILLASYSISVLASQTLMDLSAGLILIYGIYLLYNSKNLLKIYKTLCWGIEPIWLIFIPWAFVGLFLNRNLNPSWWKYFLEFAWIIFLYALIGFFLSIEELFKKHSLRIFNISFIILGGFSAFAISVFFLKYNPLTQSPESIEANTRYIWRSGGVFGNSMPFAHSYGVAACLAFGISIQAFLDKYSKNTIFWILCTLTALLSVVFSFTRGVWIGMAIAFPLMVFLIKPRLALISVLLSVLISLTLYTTVDSFKRRIDDTIHYSNSSDQIRPVLWKANWEIFKDNPWFGVGYSLNRNKLREYYDRAGIAPHYFEGHAHNQYLQWFAGTGVVGFLCYITFILSLLWISLRVYFYEALRQRISWRKGMIVGCIGAQVCFHIGSMTEANFSIAKNRYMFLLIAAISVFLLKTVEKENQPTNPNP